MLSVIHPGWLLLFICGIVLLLVGCTAFPTRVPTQSSTPYPLVTLTVYPFATESPQPRSTQPVATTLPTLRTPDWLLNRVTLTSPPDMPNIERPTCYDSPNQRIICLGRIWNWSQKTIKDVTLHLSYQTNTDPTPQDLSFSLEQNSIPPLTFAPYRVWLPVSDIEAREIQVEDYTAVASQSLPIVIEGSRGVLADSGRYIVTATLRNETAMPINAVRLAVTLLDTEERVVGYRIETLPQPIPPKSEQIVRIEITPLVAAENIHHILHVEAEPLPVNLTHPQMRQP